MLVTSNNWRNCRFFLLVVAKPDFFSICFCSLCYIPGGSVVAGVGLSREPSNLVVLQLCHVVLQSSHGARIDICILAADGFSSRYMYAHSASSGAVISHKTRSFCDIVECVWSLLQYRLAPALQWYFSDRSGHCSFDWSGLLRNSHVIVLKCGAYDLIAVFCSSSKDSGEFLVPGPPSALHVVSRWQPAGEGHVSMSQDFPAFFFLCWDMFSFFSFLYLHNIFAGQSSESLSFWCPDWVEDHVQEARTTQGLWVFSILCSAVQSKTVTWVFRGV